MHPVQWKLYAYLITQDDKEKQDEDIAKIEYAMGFYDGEAVKKVQQARAMEKYKPSDSEFSGQLERIFGRGLPGEVRKKEPEEQDDGLDQIKVIK